jgi:hypothetical protein
MAKDEKVNIAVNYFSMLEGLFPASRLQPLPLASILIFKIFQFISDECWNKQWNVLRPGAILKKLFLQHQQWQRGTKARVIVSGHFLSND